MHPKPGEKVCVKHGAKQEYCNYEGCTNVLVYRIGGGVCAKHANKERRTRCNVEECVNLAVARGVCCKHGAKRRLCNVEGCTNIGQRGGICYKHGGKWKECSVEGCAKKARCKGGMLMFRECIFLSQILSPFLSYTPSHAFYTKYAVDMGATSQYADMKAAIIKQQLEEFVGCCTSTTTALRSTVNEGYQCTHWKPREMSFVYVK